MPSIKFQHKNNYVFCIYTLDNLIILIAAFFKNDSDKKITTIKQRIALINIAQKIIYYSNKAII
jgi:hypothetical protein